MDGKNIVVMILVSLVLSACSVTVGEESTYCEEHGVDYSDAGVCDGPMAVYKARHRLRKLKGNCGSRKKGKRYEPKKEKLW